MGLKPGYKQAEVGMIPEDWSTPCLGQLIHSVEYGSSAKSRPSGKTPVLRMGNLRDGSIDWRDLVYTNNDAEIKKYLLSSGDVLFNRTNTIDLVGKTAIYKGEQSAIFAGYLIRINEDKSLLDSRFLNYVLNAEFSKKYSLKVLSVAVGQANINGKKLKTYPVPLPPTLAEQKAIAEVLSNTDVLIESLEQLLTKKRQIKQGTMQELLTGQRRLPGFTGEWMPKQFGDLLTIRHGKNQRDVESADGDFPILATGGEIGKAICPLYDKPSVLIGRKGTIDKPQYMDVPFWTVDTLFYSEVHAPNNAKFLFYRFCLIDWRRYNEASGVPSLNAKTIESVEIFCPDGNEQNSIAFLLDEIDNELATLEAQLQKARHLKQGMMQELLTGRIRLV